MYQNQIMSINFKSIPTYKEENDANNILKENYNSWNRKSTNSLSMYTSSAKVSTFLKIVAIFVVICCTVSTSTGAEISDDVGTNNLDRNLRSAVSHFLRGGRSAGTSHFLRGRRGYGLVSENSDGVEEEDEADEEAPIYQRGLRDSISHFLRGRRSSPVNHFLRGRKGAAPSGFNHFLRGGRAGVNHFLRGRKAGVVNHFLRGRKSAVNHFLRGKKASPEELDNDDIAYEEEPLDWRQVDVLY